MTATQTRVSASVICRRTGCSYRQLDYWCHRGVIPAELVDSSPGSGNHRMFDREVIEPLVIVMRVVAAMGRGGGHVPTAQLGEIFRAAQHGEIGVSFGDGIVVSWSW